MNSKIMQEILISLIMPAVYCFLNINFNVLGVAYRTWGSYAVLNSLKSLQSKEKIP